jgi:hypothetical protein
MWCAYRHRPLHRARAEARSRARGRWSSPIDAQLHSILELDDGRMVAAVSTAWEHDEANPIDIVPLGCVP